MHRRHQLTRQELLRPRGGSSGAVAGIIDRRFCRPAVRRRDRPETRASAHRFPRGHSSRNEPGTEPSNVGRAGGEAEPTSDRANYATASSGTGGLLLTFGDAQNAITLTGRARTERRLVAYEALLCRSPKKKSTPRVSYTEGPSSGCAIAAPTAFTSAAIPSIFRLDFSLSSLMLPAASLRTTALLACQRRIGCPPWRILRPGSARAASLLDRIPTGSPGGDSQREALRCSAVPRRASWRCTDR